MTDQTPARSARWLDGLAVLLSALCLVHCLTLPLFIAALPLLAGVVNDHWHAQMLFLVVPISLVAFGLGFRRHRDRRVLAGGAAGLALLFLGATLGHAWLGLVADRVLTIAGALVLAVAHYRNSVRARHCATQAG